jgi:hypothetical protein
MGSFELLSSWIKQHGGYIHPSLIINESDPGNRFIQTIHPIANKEKIFEIPNHLCLDNQTPLTVFDQPDLCLLKNDLVIVYKLCNEIKLGKESFFYPYFSYLPSFSAFENHPMYIAYKNPQILHSWKEISSLITSLTSKIVVLEKILIFFRTYFPLFTQDEIIYSYFIFMTRAWNKSGLVPFADLFQHSYESSMFLETNPNSGNPVFTTSNDIQAGDILYDNYGVYDDSLLFFNFGFLEKPDQLSKIPRYISLSVPKVDFDATLESQYKKLILDKMQMKDRKYFLTTLGLATNVLLIFRLIHINSEDIQHVDLKKETIGYNLITLDNDRRALRELTTLLKNPSNWPTPHQIQNAKLILSAENQISGGSESSVAKASSTEYTLAALTLIHYDLLDFTLNAIRKYWLEQINM